MRCEYINSKKIILVHEFEAEGLFLADQQILNLDKTLFLYILPKVKPY